MCGMSAGLAPAWAALGRTGLPLSACLQAQHLLTHQSLLVSQSHGRRWTAWVGVTLTVRSAGCPLGLRAFPAPPRTSPARRNCPVGFGRARWSCTK